MTKKFIRRIYALVAMHGMCGQGEWTNPAWISAQAFKIADEMLFREEL